MFNQYTNDNFYERTFDKTLERLRDNNNRVEITYNFGGESEEKHVAILGKIYRMDSLLFRN